MMVILLGLLLGILTPLHAATYYIAPEPTGNDATSCANAQSPSTPRKTRAGAWSCVSAGDTIILLNGTYTDSWIHPPVKGSPVSPITVMAQNFRQAIVQPTSEMAFRFSAGEHHVILKDIVYDGTDFTSPWALAQISDKAAYVTIEGSEFRNHTETASSCLQIKHDSHHITVRTSYFHHCGDPVAKVAHGVYFRGTDGLIEDNIFHDNGNLGIQIYYAGFGSTANSHTILRRNIAWNHPSAGFHIGMGDSVQAYNNVSFANGKGLEVNPTCRRCLVYNNTLHGNSKIGLWLRSGATGIAKNNISIDNGTDLRDDTNGGMTQANNRTTGKATDLWVDPTNSTLANRDYQLKSGSNAINAGTNTICSVVDLAGGKCAQILLASSTRTVINDTVDQGAYDFGGTVGPRVGDYAFNNNVNDGSGVDNHGTNSGVTFETTSPTPQGGSHSALWDAESDVVTIPTTGWSPQNMSFRVWLWLNSAPANPAFVFAHLTTNPNANRMYCQVTTSRVLRCTAGSGATIDNLATLSPGQWYHLVYTIAGDASGNGTQKAYLNGALVGSGSYSGLTTLNTVAWLGNNEASARGWNGNLDSVHIYNATLDAAPILADCESSKPSGVTCSGAPSYVERVITGGSTSSLGTTWTVNVQNSPIDPTAACVMQGGVSAVFTGAYKSGGSPSGTQPQIIGCAVNGAGDTITLIMDVPPASGSLTVELTDTVESVTVNLTNNFTAGSPNTDLAQTSYRMAYDGSLFGLTPWRGARNTQARVPVGGAFLLQILLENTGSAINDQGLALYCDETRVTDQFGSLGLRYRTDLSRTPGLAHGTASNTTGLSAGGGVTIVPGGTVVRQEPIIVSLGGNQAIALTFGLELQNDPEHVGETWDCEIRQANGADLGAGITAEVRGMAPAPLWR